MAQNAEGKTMNRMERSMDSVVTALEADIALMQAGPRGRLIAKFEEVAAAMVKRLKEPVK